MAQFAIPYLKIKPRAGGRWGYYWEPSPALARAGWTAEALGMSADSRDRALIAKAEKRNELVEAWRNGGSAPKAVKALVKPQTMAALIASYRAEIAARLAQFHLPPAKRNPTIGKPLSPNTAKAYRTAVTKIEAWTTIAKKPGGPGNTPIAAITRDRVLAFRDALMIPAEEGDDVPHDTAHNTLRVGRTMFAHGVRKGICDSNPFEDFELGAAPGRDAVWDRDGGRADIEAFARGAAAIGYPSLAFAAELAEYCGQREDDLLSLTDRNWKPVILHDPVLLEALRGSDDRLMGITLEQKKTGAWVGVPIVGELRRKVEAVIAAQRARNPNSVAPVHLLIDDRTGKPWKVRQFQRMFERARAWAIDPPAEARAQGIEPHPALAELQYRDFRRTCVVRMLEKNLEQGLIGSITGHSPKTIQRMMEIYGPRTTRQAAIAILAIHGRTATSPAADRQQENGA